MGPSGSGKTVSTLLMHNSLRFLTSHNASSCVSHAWLYYCSVPLIISPASPLDVLESRPCWMCWPAARTRVSLRVTWPLAARCPPGPTCADTRGEGKGPRATAQQVWGWKHMSKMRFPVALPSCLMCDLRDTCSGMPCHLTYCLHACLPDTWSNLTPSWASSR